MLFKKKKIMDVLILVRLLWILVFYLGQGMKILDREDEDVLFYVLGWRMSNVFIFSCYSGVVCFGFAGYVMKKMIFPGFMFLFYF